MFENQITQYFKVIISTAPEFKGNRVSVDVTNYIQNNLTYSDEDGLAQELKFELTEAYMLMDVLSIGMRIDMYGGDLTNNQLLFIGFIKNINPVYEETGDVHLKITGYSEDGKTLATKIKDLAFPSSTHPKMWARKSITYSNIILNICKDQGYKLGQIKVLKDVMATDIKSVRQHNQTDYAFIQFLAGKINCTAWCSIEDGERYINLMDDSLLTNKLADYTFFWVSRKSASEFVQIPINEKSIQLLSCDVHLDTKDASAGVVKQTTDKGKTITVIEGKNEKGEDDNTGRWVLDEEKLRGLSSDERFRIMNLFVSGKLSWDGENGTVSVKTYFKYEKYDSSSREGIPTNTEVQQLGGNLKDNGFTGSQDTTVKTGSKVYKTVIDEEKLRKLSSEDRTAIMGRIARGQATEVDKDYYKVIDSTPNESVDDKKATGPVIATPLTDKELKKLKAKNKKSDLHDKTRRKRDDGFKIEAKCMLDLRIKTKLSYVLEGLGKYSDKYYLYRITHSWGVDGPRMTLTFVK